MKQFSLLAAFVFSATFFLQAQRITLDASFNLTLNNSHNINFDRNNLLIDDQTPFIAFSATLDLPINVMAEEVKIKLIYSTEEENNIQQQLRNDGHSSPEDYVSELLFLPSDAHDLSFKIDPIFNIENIDISFHFFNPQPTPKQEPKATLRLLEDCNCPQPEYQSRADWCPTGTCPEGTNPVQTEVSHLIVHHSAGVNTSSDWSAVVRAIWDYHVNSNGWDDVGYNWLIDPNGVIYEGRGNDIRGAHFCGNNTGTQGICMIGTYIDDAPTTEAMTALKEFLAWKSANDNIDPRAISFHAASGTDVPHVAGHRDGCSTTCPGDMLYALMPQLRTDIRQYQARICGHPHSVTDLELSLENSTDVQLSWLDNSETEDVFWVQRAIGINGNFSTIETLPVNTENFLDTETEAQTLYRYQIMTVAGDSTSTCHIEAEITTQGTSSNSNVLSKNEVQLFPNPTEDYVHFILKNEYEGLVNLEIKDIMGQQVSNSFLFEKGEVGLETNLSLDNLARGVYFLEVKAGAALGVFRFIKN